MRLLGGFADALGYVLHHIGHLLDGHHHLLDFGLLVLDGVFVFVGQLGHHVGVFADFLGGVGHTGDDAVQTLHKGVEAGGQLGNFITAADRQAPGQVALAFGDITQRPYHLIDRLGDACLNQVGNRRGNDADHNDEDDGIAHGLADQVVQLAHVHAGGNSADPVVAIHDGFGHDDIAIQLQHARLTWAAGNIAG